ncbi:ERV-BabFcenv provirus ancestral Env polyprotein-like [Symphalangus syndactylus]|uniref:ERV-BabFcenv provirus ancestral Env polyprotein-like n=1 Tax=Symphalangus syndactylus TaxID=9590 RepID=UPI0030047A41
MLGISLTTSLIGTGLRVTSLGYNVSQFSDFQTQMQTAIEETAQSLAALQRQITSLAGVTLQNRHAINLLTAEKGTSPQKLPTFSHQQDRTDSTDRLTTC